MISGKNYIGFDNSSLGLNTINSVKAENGKNLNGTFYAATTVEVNIAVAKANKAFKIYSKLSGEKKAVFLDAIATEMEGISDELIDRASLESGLPIGRFQGELGRTTTQLRLFASLLRDGNWVEPVIDTILPDRIPLPRADLRKMLTAVGPVVVFGASNFPLAFSTAGGDTASALASGCPVIVKSHNSHIGVNDLVAGAINRAAKNTNMPDGVFSSLNGSDFEVGKALVLHKGIKSVAFTGSFNGGKALYDLAQTRDEPIPVFAEMGSINPVVLLENKLQSDPVNLATTYAGSITLGVGQFCTNPGLLIGIKSAALNQFSASLSTQLDAIGSGTMLSEQIAKNYTNSRHKTLTEKDVVLSTKESSGKGVPTLATTSGKNFINNPNLHQEIFGPFSILIECENQDELTKVVSALEGQLTGTIMGTLDDLNSNTEIINLLEQKVGRLIFNSAPTGVEVCHAMNHGGPYPATTDSRFTSVGTGAIKRFVRPICYQGMPDSLLPEELRNENKLNLSRKVNGSITTDSIG